jgi:hypothetical protein
MATAAAEDPAADAGADAGAEAAADVAAAADDDELAGVLCEHADSTMAVLSTAVTAAKVLLTFIHLSFR